MISLLAIPKQAILWTGLTLDLLVPDLEDFSLFAHCSSKFSDGGGS